MKITGTLYVRLDITAHERRPRIVCWLPEQDDPATAVALTETGATPGIVFPSTARGDTWTGVVSFDVHATGRAVDETARMVTKLIVDEVMPRELSPGTVWEGDLTTDGRWAPFVVGTVDVPLLRLACAGTWGPQATKRPGTHGPPKGWFAFATTNRLSSDDPLVSRALAAADVGDHRLRAAARAAAEWAVATFDQTYAQRHTDRGAQISDHPFYHTVVGKLPAELFYCPRRRAFARAAYERLVDAAVACTQTTRTEVSAVLARRSDGRYADPTAVGGIACRVLARTFGLVGSCLRYVPDFMLRATRPTWHGSDALPCPSLGPDMYAEVCDAYEDPLLTATGDCEELTRLVHQCAHDFRGAVENNDQDACMRALAGLREAYVFVACIATVQFFSGESASADVGGGVGRHSAGGGQDSMPDSHVCVVGLPAAFFCDAAVRGRVVPTRAVLESLFPAEALAASVDLPVIFSEGTNAADPLQHAPDETSHRWRGTAREEVRASFATLRAVDARHPLSRATVLAEIRDYEEASGGAVARYYGEAVRALTWDLAARGLRHVRFEFRLDGAVGLPVRDLLRKSSRASLTSVGAMPGDVFAAAQRLVAHAEPPTSVSVAAKTAATLAPLYDSVGGAWGGYSADAVLLCVKKIAAAAPATVAEIAALVTEGFEVATHVLELNEQMAALFVLVRPPPIFPRAVKVQHDPYCPCKGPPRTSHVARLVDGRRCTLCHGE